MIGACLRLRVALASQPSDDSQTGQSGSPLKSLLEFRPMAEAPSTLVVPEATEEERTEAGDGLEASVVVYNCNCHTYEQVITLFCEAIPGMTPQRAFELAWKIDHQGSATVYSGPWKTAESIAKHLGGGGLRVAIR